MDPNNDAVRKKGIIDYIIDKFGTLTKNYYVQFNAESNGKKVVQNAIITVRMSTGLLSWKTLRLSR